MDAQEINALQNELYKLQAEYSLTDESPENFEKKARIKEIRKILGIKNAGRKSTWLNSDCRKYAKYF